jgi:hypothetical protein
MVIIIMTMGHECEREMVWGDQWEGKGERVRGKRIKIHYMYMFTDRIVKSINTV